MRARTAWSVVVVAAMAIVAGCQMGCHERPSSGLAEVKVRIGSRDFWLEVADTESSREKGLMQRDSLGADRGMIFVFDEPAERSFWMKNTRIPLDIIFLDENGRVVSVSHMKPYDLHTTASDGAAKYAIELNDGAAAAAGVKEGDVVEVPGTLKAK